MRWVSATSLSVLLCSVLLAACEQDDGPTEPFSPVTPLWVTPDAETVPVPSLDDAA